MKLVISNKFLWTFFTGSILGFLFTPLGIFCSEVASEVSNYCPSPRRKISCVPFCGKQDNLHGKQNNFGDNRWILCKTGFVFMFLLSGLVSITALEHWIRKKRFPTLLLS